MLRKFTFPLGEANQESMTPTPPLESLETLQPLFLAELGIQIWFVISPLLLPVSWDKINVCLFNLSSAILYCTRRQQYGDCVVLPNGLVCQPGHNFSGIKCPLRLISPSFHQGSLPGSLWLSMTLSAAPSIARGHLETAGELLLGMLSVLVLAWRGVYFS